MASLLRNIENRIDGSIGRRNLGYGVLAALLVYFLLYPLNPNQSNYAKTVFVIGFHLAILASSWALLAGIAGQFSFGHMAFVGIGAYAAGLFARDGIAFIGLSPESISPVFAIIVGTLTAGLVGLLLGWLLLRLRSSYLALFTIAFSELFRIVMLTEYDYTGGSNGLGLRRLIVMENLETARLVEYYLMFGLLVASLGVMYLVANSRIGLYLRAMREDEDAASSLGVNVVQYKVMVFVITSMIVGLSGAVYYSGVGSERIIPEQLEILQMSLVIAFAVVGGMESLLGAAVGAFLANYLLESMRQIPLPVTFTYEGGAGGIVIRLVMGLVVIIAGAFAERIPAIKKRVGWFRAAYIAAAVIVVLTVADITPEPSTFDTSFWRYAIFGVIMMVTLRYMRNGLLHPVIEWFSGRDNLQKENGF